MNREWPFRSNWDQSLQIGTGLCAEDVSDVAEGLKLAFGTIFVPVERSS